MNGSIQSKSGENVCFNCGAEHGVVVTELGHVKEEISDIKSKHQTHLDDHKKLPTKLNTIIVTSFIAATFIVTLLTLILR